jgi:hypothetical protein
LSKIQGQKCARKLFGRKRSFVRSSPVPEDFRLVRTRCLQGPLGGSRASGVEAVAGRVRDGQAVAQNWNCNGLCFDKIIYQYFGAPKITTTDIPRGKKKIDILDLLKNLPKMTLVEFELCSAFDIPHYQRNFIFFKATALTMRDSISRHRAR